MLFFNKTRKVHFLYISFFFSFTSVVMGKSLCRVHVDTQDLDSDKIKLRYSKVSLFISIEISVPDCTSTHAGQQMESVLPILWEFVTTFLVINEQQYSSVQMLMTLGRNAGKGVALPSRKPPPTPLFVIWGFLVWRKTNAVNCRPGAASFGPPICKPKHTFFHCIEFVVCFRPRPH